MIHKIAMKVARLMAVAGGLVLSALIVLTCLSVLGRTLNGLLHGPLEALAPGLAAWLLGLGIGPVNGDFELVEAGMAFAIFAFLPLCQITSGHAVVDIFTNRMSPRAQRVLRAASDLAFAAVLVLIAVQLADGMLSKKRYGETSFLLQYPVWWAYAASLSAAAVAALSAVYVAAVRLAELATGAVILPDHGGADH